LRSPAARALERREAKGSAFASGTAEKPLFQTPFARLRADSKQDASRKEIFASVIH